MAEMAIHIIEYCYPINLFTNAKKKKKKTPRRAVDQLISRSGEFAIIMCM